MTVENACLSDINDQLAPFHPHRKGRLMQSEASTFLTGASLGDILLMVGFGTIILIELIAGFWLLGKSFGQFTGYLRSLPTRLRTWRFWENVFIFWMTAGTMVLVFAVLLIIFKLGLCILSVGALC